MKKLCWRAIPVLAGAFVLAGCSQGVREQEYDVHGQVVKVDRARHTLTIHHDDIPGFAGVTDTQFEVQDPRLLDNLRPDDEVRGRLHVRSNRTVLVSLERLSSDKDATVRSARAKLGPADRKLVEAQDICPIRPRNRLGAMGKPFKVTIKDQPVFLCCPGCEEDALADPDRTLARVAELKRAGAARKPSGPDPLVGKNRARLGPEDRRLADAQDRCPIQPQNRIGAMGKPIKVLVKEQPVFLC